MFITMYQKAYH